MTKSPLDKAYQAAEQMMKDKSKSFYMAFKVLPDRRFRAVAAVYAFCRYADDLVDDSRPQDASQVRADLEELQLALASLYGQGSPQTELANCPWWPAFAQAVADFQLPEKPFKEQIEGQLRDLDFRPLADWPELMDYCRLVAGSVGAMLWPILAKESVLADEQANQAHLQACYDLGMAMQLTNILRDIGEDIRDRQRIYLPQSLLENYQVSQLELVAWSQSKRPHLSANFKALWEAVASQADKLYDNYKRYLSGFYPACQLPLMAAAMSYQAIEDKVRQDDYNCLTKRHYTTKAQRLKLLTVARKELAARDS